MWSCKFKVKVHSSQTTVLPGPWTKPDACPKCTCTISLPKPSTQVQPSTWAQTAIHRRPPKAISQSYGRLTGESHWVPICVQTQSILHSMVTRRVATTQPWATWTTQTILPSSIVSSKSTSSWPGRIANSRSLRVPDIIDTSAIRMPRGQRSTSSAATNVGQTLTGRKNSNVRPL